MPSREAQFRVYLHDRPVGRLHRLDNLTRFAFDPDYWDDPHRAVLGLRFEDNRHERHRSNMRLPPWFSNLLPEGRLREWIASARGASVEREMDLLAQVGHDLPGAVRVLPADETAPVEMFFDKETNAPHESGAFQRLWRFSLAGVGLKFSMLAQGDRLTVPAYGEGGDWILKLPDPVYPDLPWNEYAMMTLAGAAGIEIPQIRLIHRDLTEFLPERVWAGGQSHAYAIKRFDRGLRRESIHIEDLAQVRGVWPEGKYRGNFETVGALIYRNRDVEALREFARRLAFNILVGNGDAHLKNWSLIYRDPRIPALSPAYDLVATFVYRRPLEGAEEMALSFGGSKRFEDMRWSAFSRLDEKLRAQAELGDVARTLASRVIEELPRAEALLENRPELRRRIRTHIEERTARFLR